MKIKDYLNLSYEINQSLISKKAVLKELDKSISSTTDKKLIEKLKKEKKKLQISINNDIYTRIDILRVIEKVKDATLRSVLEYKYICGLSFDEIAHRLNYSNRHITRIHSKALSEAQKLYKNFWLLLF